MSSGLGPCVLLRLIFGTFGCFCAPGGAPAAPYISAAAVRWNRRTPNGCPLAREEPATFGLTPTPSDAPCASLSGSIGENAIYLPLTRRSRGFRFFAPAEAWRLDAARIASARSLLTPSFDSIFAATALKPG